MQDNHESIIFIWFDPQDQSGLNLVGPLRAINHHVQAFIDSLTCINAIKSSKEKIFFITSSSDSELIATVHNLAPVEAMFILASNVESIKGDFPKLCGIYSQQEELFRELKEILDVFEQIQLESFAFEHDKVFLWSQLWKEELTNRKVSSKKNIFIEATRQYYRDNVMILRTIDELDKSYRPTEVMNWCFRSPFPSRFLHHALRSHNKEQLNVCRFLFADASRFLQQQRQRKSSDKFYRGMKLSSELLDKFKVHVGQLVCTSGFFPCIKSRANALTLATLPVYRTDLQSVLFKIDCDASTPCIELANKNSSPFMVFDICTAFHIVYVNRDQMTIIKMKTASEMGRKNVSDYIEQHKDETIQSLLDELMKSSMRPKPGTLPPLRPKSRPVSSQKKDSTLTAEEIKAQKCAEKGEVDRALAIYHRIQPVTARVLNTIGQLCADKKEDYNYALQCHTKALKMQEEAGEDIGDTLTNLGNVYHNCHKYDLALSCHTRALALRQANQSPDDAATASNLIGIANAHWAHQEYPAAIDNVQRALALREHIVPPNKISVAATLAMLGNIYQDCGNVALALDLCKKALVMFESTYSPDPSVLAELHYSLGTMHLSTGSFDDAYLSFENVAKIYRQIFPQGHPDRLAAENDVQQVIMLRHKSKKDS
ncbi:unnamed protein product [Rotaria sp. Silwood2]|nr:unnamed protein product [Rotaria sp. Silwood2]CAF2530475.1 unnamed protein product [Rotaria sp. Silwood2]CAF3970066.1 unnamed protein product [Rotaria sp. Silwood2]CAF4074826.1 unnamed protein product [Rotaria sp. Silwood2]CAF4571008.1 unnamed protein product [Rotaria sp. Silwood2]